MAYKVAYSMGNLSETAIKAMKWDGKDITIGDGDGLYILLRRSSKTWIIRKRHKGKNTITTLGKWPTLSVREARAKAIQINFDADPSNIKVGTLVDKYLKEIVEIKHKRPELAVGYMNRGVLPELEHRKVKDVTRAKLVNLIQDYTKNGARTADQLRSNLKALFGYAVELGYRDDNPMDGVTRRISKYDPSPRERVLSDDEIRLLWTWDHQNAALLRFLLLTSLRISEAQLGYRDGDRWIVPSEYSKNGKAHWAYVTDIAIEQLPFPTRRVTNTAVQAWLRYNLDKLGISPRYTPHDLRRTAATRMADCGVEPFIVERVLNHTLEGVMAVYNRAEYKQERIEAAMVLNRHIMEIVS
ncbi:MAG: integrase family protein [Candidatus Thiodiazotropha sp. (ex Lucinoma borealis)]|nr:integrase family protein [Candidatus Thiodiazotropha sp. (ex Lucinoma borealis)]